MSAFSDNINIAAQHSCNAWFCTWRDTGFLPEDAHFEACKAAGWPSDGASGEQLLFAAILYDIGQQADEATHYYISALRCDPSLKGTEELAIVTALLSSEGCPDVNPSVLAAVLAKRYNYATRLLTESRPLTFHCDPLSKLYGRAEGTPTLVCESALYLRNRLLKIFSDWTTTSPLIRIQTLLFYADAVHIAEHGTTLFEIAPLALQDGPVYSDACDLLESLWTAKTPIHQPDTYREMSEDFRELLDDVFDMWGSCDTEALVIMSQTELPWAATFKREANKTIPRGLLVQWFKSKLGQKSLRPILERRRGRLSAATAAPPTNRSCSTCDE